MKHPEKLFFFVDMTGGETVPIEAHIDPERVAAFYQIHKDDIEPEASARSGVIFAGTTTGISCLDDFQTIIDKVFDQAGQNKWILAGMVHQRTGSNVPVMIRKSCVDWVGVNPTDREFSIVSIQGFDMELTDSVESIKTQLKG